MKQVLKKVKDYELINILINWKNNTVIIKKRVEFLN